MKIDDMRHELAHLGNNAHALAVQILGNVDDAADAVQDAFAQALGRAHQYKSDRGSLRAWFLRIVRNRCIDLLRGRMVESDSTELLSDPAPGPEAITEFAQRDHLLHLALASLAAEQRQIIVLRDYMDLSYGEIAAVLGVAGGTVMSRIHRARVALAKAYREYDEQ